MAEIVYTPVIALVKTLWKYLGLEFTIEGEANIPRSGARSEEHTSELQSH